MKLAVGFIGVACTLLLLSHTTVFKARAAIGFTNASIIGTYTYESEGFVLASATPNTPPLTGDYAPFSAAGFFTFNGSGGVHIQDTVYIFGQIRHRDFTGTYSINSDGSGTLTFLSFGGTPKTRALYIAKSGEEIKFVVADLPDDGTVNAGTMVRQGHPSDN